MAMSTARATLRSALPKSGSLVPRTTVKRSSLSTGASSYEEAHEAEKWEKITLAGILTCSVLAIYNLSKGHHEHPEPPAYPYLHILNKEFPWGEEPLFEHIKKKKHSQH